MHWVHCVHCTHDNRAQLKRMSYLLTKVDKNATTYILNQNQDMYFKQPICVPEACSVDFDGIGWSGLGCVRVAILVATADACVIHELLSGVHWGVQLFTMCNCTVHIFLFDLHRTGRIDKDDMN